MKYVLQIVLALNAVLAVILVGEWRGQPASAKHRGLEVAFLYLADHEGAPIHPEALAGAREAAATLGCSLYPVPVDRNPTALMRALKRLEDRQADAVCIPAMRDQPSLEAFIKELAARGSVVTAYDESPDFPTDALKWQGFGFIGENRRQNGQAAAMELARRAKLVSGNTVLLVHGEDLWEESRAAGAIAAFKNLELDVHLLPGGFDATQSFPAALRRVLNESHEPPGAILCLTGDLTAVAAAAQEAAQPAVPVAGFFLSPESEALLRNGSITFIADQQWFVQGFVSVVQACLSVSGGYSGLDTPLTPRFLDRDTLDTYRPPALKAAIQ